MTNIVELDVTPGDVLSVSVDNSTFGLIGGDETSAEVSSQINLTFTAIPEPASAALLSLGCVCLNARRQRRAAA